jgi:hypothetical protein
MEDNVSNTMLQTVTTYEMTDAEQKLLEALLNPDYRMKSITELCNVAKISRMAYYRAMGKPEFKALYKQKTKELVENSIAPVLNTFVREALRGSFQHGKVILEMAGLYSEKTQIDVTGTVEHLINGLSRDEIRAEIEALEQKRRLKDAIDVTPEPADTTIYSNDQPPKDDPGNP